VRLVRPASDRPRSGEAAVSVRAVHGDRLLDRQVLIAYEELLEEGATGTTVLLIHGSPGSREDFISVAQLLARRHRVIVPDLPGFGRSTHSLPDYSVRAHARYLSEMMGGLAVDRAHVVGFSMGGGVALELYELAPERVRSLTLLSAIGVQELELFGSYQLNHLVHTAQLGAIWLAREALPHMGLLDGALLGVPYARNFYDTDQRPLRGILARFQPPMLILHGERDFLVPPEAAIEHHRIVPHSELQMLPASHFMLFQDGPAIALRLGEFLARVDRGEAPRRKDSAPERLELAARPFAHAAVPPFTGFALILVLALIALATLASEDLTCIGVGLLVAQGRLEFLPGVLACFVGIYFGDLLLYLAGRWLGRPALDRAPLRWLTRPEQVESASAWFERRGAVVIGLSRFIPGTRFPTYFAAGMLRTGFWAFCLYFLVAVALWTPLLVGLVALVGERAVGYFVVFQRHALPALILLGLGILIFVHLLLPLFSFRGRQRLVGRWRRLVQWEFWPPWLFYPPVVGYVLWLGLRHRSPMLFTAANPAIDAGGFISESKHEILHGLTGSAEFVAESFFVPLERDDPDPARRVERVERIMRDGGIDFPVVVKPDSGQRGSGVAIARTREQLSAYLERSRFDLLVQEYVPGKEFGIFYYRYPDRERGSIFSITEKRLPVLTGNGEQTVEELILGDRRAVCLADHYCHVQANQLGRVPAPGERVQLVELGTHCRGAIFLDGSWLLTEPLERVVDEISRAFPGFFFGRYDLRAPDVDELQQGRGFKILELNGVTSEATHIYDPGIPLWDAYRTLFAQWHAAFEIGRINRERGVRPAGLSRLWTLVREYRISSRTHPC
jgi:pimeloyl-ACP methyl ester carboxylesterase/membrane protein DedA with SNARE-associated domain